MTTNAPKFVVWVVGVVIGAIGILGHFVTTVPVLYEYHFVLVAIGFVLGFGIFYGLSSLFGFEGFGLVISIGLAVLVGSVFIMLASVIGSYTGTAYHTCLYIWAREVEKAQVAGTVSSQVHAPAPLAAVLGNI